MLIGQSKTNKFKVNIKIGGFVLVSSFLIIGILVSILELNKDIENLESEIYTNNEIVSNDILMQIGIVENFLESKTSRLNYSLNYGIDGIESNTMSLEVLEDSWTGQFVDGIGNKFYSYGDGAFQYDNDLMKNELSIVALILDDMTMLNRNVENACFLYRSNNYDVDVIYPMGSLQKDYAKGYDELKSVSNEFNSINFDGDSGTTIIGETLYIWEALVANGVTSYTGIALYNIEELLNYPYLMYSETTYIYTKNDSIILKENKDNEEFPIEEFYTNDYNLHTYSFNKQFYYYRGITDNVLYVSRVSSRSIQNTAFADNFVFFVTIILAFIILLVLHFYILKYRRYLELELESSEQEIKKTLYKSRLGYIMNTISEAFVRADSTYTILEINQAAADMLGYRISEMLGQVITDFMAKPLDVKVRKNEGLYTCYEVSLIKKDGSKLYGLVNKSTIIKDNPITKEHYIMISDITLLIKAQQKAEEANRSKSRFIANLSHEIRTPMNATIGYIYLLEQTYLSDIQKKYLEKMDYASNTLLEIIDEILDFSKIEADRITIEEIPFNLTKVLGNAISMFEDIAVKKGLQLTSTFDELVPDKITGDPYRLRQVIINLLSNAFKFTSMGSISVNVEVIDIEDSHVEEDINIESILKVDIKDSGIGIAKERMLVLFEPFVQADESTTRIFGGTGLGLTICKRLVELMGGVIYASSVEGKGSIFTIELPLKITANSIRDDEFDHSSQISSGFESKRILVVEDNSLNQELLVELLRIKGNTLVVANNGKVAEDILKSNHSQLFDLILMDIQMPIQDGFETSKFIRQYDKYATVPIIGITANADKETQVLLTQSGMDDYILKPINAADLYSRINKWNKYKYVD